MSRLDFSMYAQLFSKDRNIVVQSAEHIKHALAMASVADIFAIRHHFGYGYHQYYQHEDWKTFDPSALIDKVDSGAFLAICSLGTFHSNGYYRERCLNQLAEIGSGLALPYVFLLLNNWVPAIRQQAIKVSLQLLKTATMTEVISALCFFEAAERGQRQAARDTAAIYVAIREKIFDITPERIAQEPIYVRRLCYKILLKGEPQLPMQILLQLLEQERDIGNRIIVARAIMVRKPEDAVVDMLCHDRVASVRLFALMKKYKQKGLWAGITSFLMDKNASIRAFVGYCLRKRGDDVAEFYRRQLAQEPSAIAIRGIGETGKANDAALITPYLEPDTAPAFLKAAVVSTARLIGQQSEAMLLQMLFHKNAGKIAYQLIRKMKIPVSPKLCYDSYLSAETELTKARVLSLLLYSTVDTWERMLCMLKLFNILSYSYKCAVDSQILYSSDYTKPDKNIIEQIEEAMTKADLKPHVRNTLELSLKYWKAQGGV
ncbi:MAG: hypothetical protein LBV04_09690 [Deferribacteraceae bacterium]|jgi:hypothetical protein|nr:hypothetical protein [Deferribacteraceae bacterium]